MIRQGGNSCQFLKKGDEKMKKLFKKVVATIMVLCLSITSFCSVSAVAATADEATPYYNNVRSVQTVIGINSSGKLTINYSYTGSSSITTKAVITTYIQKKTLGLFWTRVDIGTTDDEWVDTIKKSSYTGVRTFQLSSTGTYRVVAIYKIYGSGGSADKIETKATDTY